MLADPDKRAAKAMGVLGLFGFASRVTLYADRDGKLLRREEKVSTKSHGEQVAKTLAELGIARKAR